jgi:hypothetical protein
MEHDRLRVLWTPVLVENLNAIVRLDVAAAHVRFSFDLSIDLGVECIPQQEVLDLLPSTRR